MRRKVFQCLLVALIAAAALPSAAQAAEQALYFGTHTGTLGKASLDGTSVDDSFLTIDGTVESITGSSEYLYYAQARGGGFTGAIGRVKYDGSDQDNDFITGFDPIFRMRGLAVSDTHIYWSDFSQSRISRAKLDGSDVELNFITGSAVVLPQGLALHRGYLYWSSATDQVVRAKADGSDAEVIIPSTGSGVGGVATFGSHLYVAHQSENSVGRSLLDGGQFNPVFIATATNAWQVAVNTQHIYWLEPNCPCISRADRVTGGNVDNAFIPLAGQSVALGMAPSGEPEAVVSPASADMGSVNLGSTVTETVRVTNDGGSDLRILSVALTGGNADQFKVTSDGCADSWVGPGSTCSIEVGFDPTSLGTKSATLQITHNVTDGQEDVALTGVGTSGSGPSSRSPSISKFSVSNRKPRKPVNTLKFRFDLSEPATVELVVQRKYGREQRKRCKRTTANTRLRKRCPIYRHVSSTTKQLGAGANTINYNAKGLHPGAYRARLTASNESGAARPAALIFYRPWW